MNSSKRAQGLGINMLVVIILVLVLLAGLLYVFGRGAGVFTKTTTQCAAQDGFCVKSVSACVEQGGLPLDFECPQATPVCCRR